MLSEPNRVRQWGALPSTDAGPIPVGKIPDLGTQIVLADTAENGTTVIHTVTAGKTLYLSAIFLNNFAGAAAGGLTYLFVTDSGDSEVYTLIMLRLPALGFASETNQFLPPLEIPAGYKLKVASSAASIVAYSFVHGYEA